MGEEEIGEEGREEGRRWPRGGERERGVGDNNMIGDIPYVKIEVQVSSLMQQAQDKNKKKFITVAEKVHCDKTGAGHRIFLSYSLLLLLLLLVLLTTIDIWEIPSNLVATNGKHSNYFFKLSYDPQDNKSTTTRFTSKVKGITDSFKMYHYIYLCLSFYSPLPFFFYFYF